MDGHDVVSPRIFAPSSLLIDDSQLCFNKNHFGREDFDVQRFMNLARRRAGLEQIQKDLRLYLKSVQHSMIELINDDYADFVHLSSNLVSLHSSIEKIDKDLQGIWNEFETNTGEAVGTAQEIESRCEQLTTNRHAQCALRDKIAFLSAMQRLNTLLHAVPSSTSSIVLWLEKVASCVVDLTSHAETDMDVNGQEFKAYQKILCRLEKLLCVEGVRSASGDCATLPLALSVLSLAQCSASLTAALVAELLYPKLVTSNSNQYDLLISVFTGVKKMRENWSTVLGARFDGPVTSFLDQTLITFLQTFIDKCLGMVAVPSDTRLFHRCYLATQEFIEEWPTASKCWNLLKAIRDKFNLVVYFKLETHKLIKQIDSELSPDSFSLNGNAEIEMKCQLSATILSAIEKVWSDNVYLPPLIDKLWDFTLRMLSKHLSWTRAMIQAIVTESLEPKDIVAWKALLYIRYDSSTLHGNVFDLALEKIWPKLRDLGVDSSPFGQCLTRLGSMIEVECTSIDRHVSDIVLQIMNKEFDSVSDVPKQYRWTKKPLPTVQSLYVVQAHEPLKALEQHVENLELSNWETHVKNVQMNAYQHFIQKAKDVLDSVDATGSSLSRFKRKGTTQDGATDDDKIRAQVFRDVEFVCAEGRTAGIVIDGLDSLIDRARPDLGAARDDRSVTPEVSSLQLDLEPDAAVVLASNSKDLDSTSEKHSDRTNSRIDQNGFPSPSNGYSVRDDAG